MRIALGRRQVAPLPCLLTFGEAVLSGTYSYWLVLISVLVATLASYTALDLATRITASKGRAAQLWLVGGAFSMGTGIWSMHFIGMLAFSLPVPLAYDVTITVVSLVIAIAMEATVGSTS